MFSQSLSLESLSSKKKKKKRHLNGDPTMFYLSFLILVRIEIPNSGMPTVEFWS